MSSIDKLFAVVLLAGVHALWVMMQWPLGTLIQMVAVVIIVSRPEPLE